MRGWALPPSPSWDIIGDRGRLYHTSQLSDSSGMSGHFPARHDPLTPLALGYGLAKRIWASSRGDFPFPAGLARQWRWGGGNLGAPFPQ